MSRFFYFVFCISNVLTIAMCLLGPGFTEPLQKLRVRLGTCEIGLSPPEILYY